MDKHESVNESFLMAALREGSVTAFDIIYDRYAPRVYAYCYRALGSEQETEDLVQDVFINLWRYRGRIDPELSLSTLIFSVAARYRANAFRKRLNSLAYGDYVACREDMLSVKGESTVDFDEFIGAVRHALACLPNNQRQVLELAILQDMDNHTIAEKLSLSEKTIRNLLSLGRKRLKSMLAEFLCLFAYLTI